MPQLLAGSPDLKGTLGTTDPILGHELDGGFLDLE